VLLAGEGVEEVRQEDVREGPAVGEIVLDRPDGGARREVREEDREASDREPAAPEVAEVDAVEALEIRLHGVGVVPE
jgi:hypothetical protein